MSVQVAYQKQFLIFFFLFLIILASIEIFARFYEFQISTQTCVFQNKDAVKLNQELIISLCYDYQNILVDEKPFRQNVPNQNLHTININSFGFRGDEIEIEKESGVFRIFMLGGSTMFGYGSSSDKTTIPAYLENRFAKSGLNVEVINAGVIGGYSLSETELVKKSIINLQPDMIIAYDGWNDALNNKIVSEKEETVDNFDDEFEEEKFSFLKFKNYQFYRTPFVIHRVMEQNMGTISPLNEHEVLELTQLWNERWNEICKIGEQKNFSTVVFIHPTVFSGKKPLIGDESVLQAMDGRKIRINNVMSSLASKLPELQDECTLTKDLRGIFDSTYEPIFYDIGHTNDLGNKIIAEEIFHTVYPLVK